MARKSGVLMRQLFGDGGNPCATGLLHYHHHHHHRKLVSNSIQTLTLTSTPSTTPSSSSSPSTINVLSPSKLLPSYSLHSPNLHFLQHRRRLSSASGSASASVISFSRPSDMVIIMNEAQYERAIKEVKDGLLPAVFVLTDSLGRNSFVRESLIIRKLREKFPHVTIYKIVSFQSSMSKVFAKTQFHREPVFLFYQNGKKVVDEIDGDDIAEDVDCLMDTFGKLYRYVVPARTDQPMSSSGMGKRRTQQLVIQAKKDENGKGVEGGSKLGGAGTLLQRRGGAAFLQWRGAATLAQQSRTTAAPSLRQVMWAVDSTVNPGCAPNQLWWFAKGLFISQPEKRAMFMKRRPRMSRMVWLINQMYEE